MKADTALADSRRSFLLRGGALAVTAALLGPSQLLAADKKAAPEVGVTPTEDLMREHGVLRRLMLVFDTIGSQLQGSAEFSPAPLTQATQLIRRFIQNYHEKDEEDFIFPRFTKAGKLTDLVKVLYAQHQAGRKVIAAVDAQASPANLKNLSGREKIRGLLISFNRMYRPHAAWEDTVLYPAFRSVITPREFADLGDKFEDKELELFGEEGFAKIVAEVAQLEKELKIHDLAQFTPKV